MTKKFLSLLQIIAILIAMIFGYKTYQELKTLWDSQASTSALKTLAVTENTHPFDRKIDFTSLEKINPDILAWVYVPDTNIDYPVLKGQSDDGYLYQNIDKNYDPLGSITTFNDTDTTFNKAQTFIYGHNGVKDMMFDTLTQYTDKTFREEHPTFYVYTKNKTYECSIFSVFIADESEKDTYKHDFEIASIEHVERINELIERNSYLDLEKEDIGEYIHNEIFTLFTCYGNVSTPKRILINATAVKTKYIID